MNTSKLCNLFEKDLFNAYHFEISRLIQVTKLLYYFYVERELDITNCFLVGLFVSNSNKYVLNHL